MSHTLIVAVHGIGNQREGSTGSAIRQALPRYLSAGVEEFYWARQHIYRGRPLASAGWLVRVASILPVLACLPDDRDEPSDTGVEVPSRRRKIAHVGWLILLGALLYRFFGLRGTALAAIFYWLAVRSPSVRRLIARLSLVLVPAIMLISEGKVTWLASPVILVIIIFVAPGPFSFVRSLTLAREGDDQLLPIEELATHLKRAATSNRVLVVAHSMGAYLTLRALQSLASEKPTSQTLRITVLGLGSAARSLSVLAHAQRSSTARLWAWACIASALISAIGLASLIQAVFLAPKGASRDDVPLEAVFTIPLLLGVLAFALGTTLASWSVRRFRACFSWDQELPSGVRWIDCSSVHDSVGRVNWPVIRGSERIPISGQGLPLPDHSLNQYLKNPTCRKLLKRLGKHPRSNIDDLCVAGRGDLDRSQGIEDQRESFLFGLLGALGAISNDAIRPRTGSPLGDAFVMLLWVAGCFAVAFLFSRGLRMPQFPRLVLATLQGVRLKGAVLVHYRYCATGLYLIAAASATRIYPLVLNIVGPIKGMEWGMARPPEGNLLLNAYFLILQFLIFFGLGSIFFQRSVPSAFFVFTLVLTMLLLGFCLLLMSITPFATAGMTSIVLIGSLAWCCYIKARGLAVSAPVT